VAQCTGRIALADDSGLEVRALGERPASTRPGTLRCMSGNDPKNYEKLLKDMSNILPRSEPPSLFAASS